MTAQVLASSRRYTLVPLTQCAWCSRISILGRYVRIFSLGKVSRRFSLPVPLVGQMEVGVSHGICPDCYGRICGDADLS